MTDANIEDVVINTANASDLKTNAETFAFSADINQLLSLIPKYSTPV